MSVVQTRSNWTCAEISPSSGTIRRSFRKEDCCGVICLDLSTTQAYTALVLFIAFSSQYFMIEQEPQLYSLMSACLL